MSTTKFPKKLQDEINFGKKFAVGYRRISDEKQRERASFNTQTNLIEKYCKEHDLTLLETYEDECISGLKSETRNGYLKMLQEEKAWKFYINL